MCQLCAGGNSLKLSVSTCDHCGYHRYYITKVWVASADVSALCGWELSQTLRLHLQPAPLHCRAYGQSVTFRFREFYQFSQGFGSEDLVLGLGILVLEHLVFKENVSILVKILVSSHSAFMGCFYWTWSMVIAWPFQCFEDLIGSSWWRCRLQSSWCCCWYWGKHRQ